MNLLFSVIMSLSSSKDIKIGNCYMFNTYKIVALATDKEGVLFRYTTDIDIVYWTAFDDFVKLATPTQCYGK